MSSASRQSGFSWWSAPLLAVAMTATVSSSALAVSAPVDPSVVAASQPSVEASPAVAAPALAAEIEPPILATGPGSAVSDVQIYGLLNHHVDVLMADGTHIQGNLIGYDPQYVILENPQTMQRYQIDRRMMSGVRMVVNEAPPAPAVAVAHATVAPGQLPRVAPLSPLPPPRGVGKIAAGAVVTGVGAVLLFSTVSLVMSNSYFSEMSIPLGMAAAVHLGVGIPMLASGLRRQRRYKTWQHNAQRTATWVPSIHIDRHGAQGGLRLRF